MSTRQWIVAGFALIVALGAAGCSSGIKEGMPEDLAPSADFLQHEREVGKLNVQNVRR